MKPGQTITDPRTGRQGTITAITNETVFAVTPDRREFKIARPQRPAEYNSKHKRPCEAKMPGFFDWLSAEWIGPKTVRITAADPIWHGAELTTGMVKVRRVR